MPWSMAKLVSNLWVHFSLFEERREQTSMKENGMRRRASVVNPNVPAKSNFQEGKQDCVTFPANCLECWNIVFGDEFLLIDHLAGHYHLDEERLRMLLFPPAARLPVTQR